MPLFLLGLLTSIGLALTVAYLHESPIDRAGTVLDPEDVAKVKDAGGRLVVSPNTDIPVIEATVTAGMVSSPGYFTPSEAFDAILAGAHSIKLFPAEAASPKVVKASPTTPALAEVRCIALADPVVATTAMDAPSGEN